MKRIFLIYGLAFILQSCLRSTLVQNTERKFLYAQSNDITLAPPMIQSSSIFFGNENKIDLDFRLEKGTIRYTLDGSEPTQKSLLIAQTFVLTESTIVKAKVFHPDFLPSSTVKKQFIKLGDKLPIKHISLNRPAHKDYPGNGPDVLLDRKKGTKDFRTSDWLGFAGGDLEITIELLEKRTIHRTIVSLLSDQSSWIFMPKVITILASNDGHTFKEIATQLITPTSLNSASEFNFISLDFPEVLIQFVKVKIEPDTAIPDWHSGKGKTPWLFIDEILIE